MQSGSNTRKTFAYLKKLKTKSIDFDFLMHFDEDDYPNEIVQMTLTMLRTLLQYGDILFFNAQKRQYNKMCWPYIGPIVKNNENKI